MSRSKVAEKDKIRAVKSYMQGELGFGEIMDRYNVPKSTLTRWIRNYKIFGVEGLITANHNQSFSSEVKKRAVEEYRSGKGSLHDICKKYKIRSDTQLRYWIKVYNSHRELRPNSGRGSDIYMTKGRNTT